MKRPLKTSKSRPSGIAIVGPGRLGQALGKLLRQAGLPVRFVAARKMEQARRAVRFIGRGRAVPLDDPKLASAAIILLTVSDGAIAPVAQVLARLRDDWSGRVVLHCCGSLAANVLGPFRRRGAAVGSLHPFQTIPNPVAGVRNLVKCYWSIDGDPQARKVAARWVKQLLGEAFRVPTEQKTLYHLSAFLVCPAIVTLLDQSEKLLRRVNVPARIIRPMLERFVVETIRNFAKFGGRKSLTGPATRGDWATLGRHWETLCHDAPELVPLYSEMVALMLRLARSGATQPERLHRIASRTA